MINIFFWKEISGGGGNVSKHFKEEYWRFMCEVYSMSQIKVTFTFYSHTKFCQHNTFLFHQHIQFIYRSQDTERRVRCCSCPVWKDIDFPARVTPAAMAETCSHSSLQASSTPSQQFKVTEGGNEVKHLNTATYMQITDILFSIDFSSYGIKYLVNKLMEWYIPCLLAWCLVSHTNLFLQCPIRFSVRYLSSLYLNFIFGKICDNDKDRWSVHKLFYQ